MPSKHPIPKERVPIEQFASGMRFEPTRHEMLMWNALLAAFKPYRVTVHAQEPVGPYIADFYISPCNVVIEVDGNSHASAREHDQRRDSFMKGRGITVMRFKNQQIRRNPDACAKYVLSRCLPLSLAQARVKVTMCPPGSALRRKSKKLARIWWT